MADEKIYILAVDDEPNILEVYKEILSPKARKSSRLARSDGKSYRDLRENFHVETASSGDEAIDIVKRYKADGNRICTGFFDMRMPGKDGGETIKEIIKIDPDMQCVVVTADTDRNPNEILQLFHDPSQFVYLNKPFNLPEISQLALSLSSLWVAKRQTERMMDSIVQASVHAIESRDPTTSGHSERVAQLTVGLAQSVDHLSDGIFAQVKFNRYQLESIRYASLLHDFGKIGVREHVLIKSKKLYPKDLEKIALKFELEHIKGLLTPDQKERWWNHVQEANQPSILPTAIQFDLDEIFNKGLITEEEFLFLTIPRGTLTESERKEIENHVNVTYKFLKTIAWTKDFESVPDIAHAHHEKMDGTGYPRGIKDIPIESRMMTIADIFDALTASDRPYKKAVPLERALDIIAYEVKNSKCDGDLFRIFVEGRVYENLPSFQKNS